MTEVVDESAEGGLLQSLVHGSVKLRHLGLGFVWAWIYCAFNTSALFPDRVGNNINSDASWIVSSATVVIVLFLGGFLLTRFNGDKLTGAKRYAFPATAGILCAVGTAASAFVPDGAEPLAQLCGVLTGVGSGLLVLFWFDSLARLNIEEGETAVVLSSVVTLLCTLTIPYLTGVIGVVAVSSLPIIAGVLLIATDIQSPVGEVVPRRNDYAPQARMSFFRAVIVVTVAYFAFCCVGVFSDPADEAQAVIGYDISTGLGSLLGIVVLVVFIRFSMRTDFTGLFRWMTPLLICCIALYPWESSIANFTAGTLSSILDTVLQAMSILCVIVLVKQGAMKSMMAAGVCQGFIQLGVLLGNYCGSVASEYVYSGELSIFVVVLVLICGYSLVSVLLPRGEVVPEPLVSAPVAEAMVEQIHSQLQTKEVVAADDGAVESPGANDASGAQVSPDAVEDSCARVAAECGLSAREAEILVYLAHGRTQPYIREQLVLSQNTVATHVKHIYQKLGVHSKQELIDLIER